MTILPYLIASVVIYFICILSSLKAGADDVRESPRSARLYKMVAPSALFWIATQLVVVGSINAIRGEVGQTILIAQLLTSYAGVVVFFIACYQLLSKAETTAQHGGNIAFSYFGRPRSRRFLFAVFGGYVTCSVLTIMSLEVSLAVKGWRPQALFAPDASLLMAAIMSLITAFLLASRYKGITRQSIKLERFIMLLAILFMIGTGFIEVYLLHEYYSYILSAVIALSCALSAIYLSRRRELFANTVI